MHPLNLSKSTNLVLLFHDVPSINWFRSTLITIKKIYKFISVENVESYFYNNKEFNNCCHICFDDGTRTVYYNAFPVLKEMNIPATLFVSPKIVSDESNYWFQELSYIKNQLDDKLLKEIICEIFNCNYEQIKKFKILSIFKCMKLVDILRTIDIIKKRYDININNKYNITKNQLLELNNSDLITIGAHTLNHPILCNENEEEVEKEIRKSIENLSKMLGKDIKYFAYPNGKLGLDYSTIEQLILRRNKIKLAFTTVNSFFNKETNPLSIPRSGFTGLKIEKGALILSKLFVVPIWDNILEIIFLGKTESRERKEIKELSIF